MHRIFSTWTSNIKQRLQENSKIELSNPSGTGASHTDFAPPAIKRTPVAERTRAQVAEEDFRVELQRQGNRYQAQQITEEEFTQWFSRRCIRAQSQAFHAGKRYRGDYSPLNQEEVKFLHGQHSQQMKYFRKMLKAYKDGTAKMPFLQRLDLYGLDTYAIFLKALYGNADALARFFWRLGNAEHCNGCIWRATESLRRGGFTKAELDGDIGYPGDGHTECINHCECELVEAGGKRVGKRFTKPLNDIKDEAEPPQVTNIPVKEVIVEPDYSKLKIAIAENVIAKLPTGMQKTATKAFEETLGKPLPENWMNQISDQLGHTKFDGDNLSVLFLGWLMWYWFEQERKRKEKQEKKD